MVRHFYKCEINFTKSIVFFKIRHIVYKLEEHFAKEINRSGLIKVFNLYIAMNDYYHAEEWLNEFATKVDYKKG